MRYRGGFAGCVLLAMLSIPAAVAGECQIERFPAVPVVMRNLQPLVSAEINGHKARFLVDTGSFWSLLSPAAQAEYHLPDDTGPMGVWLKGVNGSVPATLTTVNTFTFLHVRFRSAQFLVGGNAFAPDIAGLLGGTVLRLRDMEYDFGDGLMRFIQTKGCKGVPLAYWAHDQPVGAVRLRSAGAKRPYLIGTAWVNGKVIRVLFDSGASRSMLTLNGAKRAGITPASPGVKYLGRSAGGIGRKWIKIWSAPVAVFEIGDEKIERSHILVGDFNMSSLRIGMVLGSDFFLSHHILVAYHRRMLYFTYNGGPVFALGQRYFIQRPGSALVAAGPGVPVSSSVDDGHKRSSVPAPGPAVSAVDRRSQAGMLMRRGMAYASDRQYARALLYLNRACRLAPRNAEYHFRRGKVEWADRRPAKALADFDAAIKLKPDLYLAHLSRAQLLLGWRSAPQYSRIQARADINIVSLLAPDESQARLQVANLDARMGQYAAGIRAIKLWMFYHRYDAKLPIAWNRLCWIRAEGDMQLHEALRDCRRAHERLPKSAMVFDSNGLIYLRLKQFRRSIKNYDAALRIAPKAATSLFGRALAEMLEGKTALGRAGLGAAVKLDPGVLKLFAHMRDPLISPKKVKRLGIACANCSG